MTSLLDAPTSEIQGQQPLPGIGGGNWFTPHALFAEIEAKYGPFTLDAAASVDNTKCQEYFTIGDGLAQKWHGRVWCNPPYQRGEILKWVQKAFSEVQSGNCEIAVLLLPAQTSTKWFHEYALKFGELYWVRGKRRFGNQKFTAFNGSVAVVFKKAADNWGARARK